MIIIKWSKWKSSNWTWLSYQKTSVRESNGHMNVFICSRWILIDNFFSAFIISVVFLWIFIHLFIVFFHINQVFFFFLLIVIRHANNGEQCSQIWHILTFLKLIETNQNVHHHILLLMVTIILEFLEWFCVTFVYESVVFNKFFILRLPMVEISLDEIFFFLPKKPKNFSFFYTHFVYTRPYLFQTIQWTLFILSIHIQMEIHA